jgi:uncharacterized delta-60 repeat protein
MKTFLCAAAGIAMYFLVYSSSLRAQPGSLDITFNPGAGVNYGNVNGIALQQDGKILIAGNFSAVNNTNRRAIARLNTDGGLDTTFDPGDGVGSQILSMALQADGKAIIGGDFSSVNGFPRQGVARLRTDGSLDVGFAPNSPLFNYPSIYAIALQTNGQILVGGNLSTLTNAIVRFDTNAALDATFSFNPVAPVGLVHSIALQADGKILVGGPLGIVRLNPDGSGDPSFAPGSILGDDIVNSVVVQNDGNVLIGGSFFGINGYTRHNIARLNIDGSLDLTFNPVQLTYGQPICSLALQNDGKILVGFGGSLVGGVPSVILARLSTNGSLDMTFSLITSASGGKISAIALQPDGKAIIGGSFGQVDGTNINRIARLNGDNSSSTNLQFLACNQYFGTFLQGTVSNTYRIEYTSKLNTPSLWTPLFNVTLQTNPQFILDPNPVTGQRFYRAVALQ